jgi:predicted anti-sigma-YlaC factor YlaD
MADRVRVVTRAELLAQRDALEYALVIKEHAEGCEACSCTDRLREALRNVEFLLAGADEEATDG